jgi:hypothetical protein
VNYATDDIVNGIADIRVADDSPQSAPLPVVGSTYIKLLPELNEVKQGDTQVFTASLYVADILTPATFTFSHTGVESKYYALTVINSTSFSIKSNYMYMKNPIKVTCTCTTKATTFDIWLAGW